LPFYFESLEDIMQGYLEGCRIFLSGFSTVEQETLKKIINNGGGMRLDTLSTRVTHIVTKSTIVKEVRYH
jgi:topoisomerase (DNA) II binding protein 1